MLFQLSMYYLSFTPLWIVIIIMDAFNIYDQDAYLTTEYISVPVIALLFLFSVICVKKELNPKQRDNAKEYEILECTEEKFIVAEFLMSFIFPLFAFDFTQYRSVLYFVIFFVIFEWLCYRHNYFCVNVILEAMHYKIYDCKIVNYDEIEMQTKILSKRQLKQCTNAKFIARYLNNDYMVDCYLASDYEEDCEA